MPKHYKTIDGWFDYADLYDSMVNKYDNCTFVEVGTWLGRSAVYMGEKIREMNKNIQLVCIDTWEGSDEVCHQTYIQGIGGPNKLFEQFKNNVANAKLNDYIKWLRLSSDKAAQMCLNRFAFVFIDADHHYESVKKDISSWLPHVMQGGTIAGHDYDVNNPASDGVIRAVKESFGSDYNVLGKCWVKEL